MRTRWAWTAVVLLLGLVIADAVLFWGARGAAAEAAARTQAVHSAERMLPQLLGYDYRTLPRDQKVALAQTTGSFRDDYAKILRSVVTPNATSKKVSTRAKVGGAAVVSGDERRVVVLVFLTQSTTRAGAVPQVTGSRVNVTMTRTDDGWRISDLDPV